MSGHDDPSVALEWEYCPPIDTATFRAIVSDYDLDDPASVETVRTTLEILKSSAELEESTGFDASGSSKPYRPSTDQQALRESAASSSPDHLTASDSTELTGIEASLQSFGLDSNESSVSGPSRQEYDREIDKLPVDEKIAILAESFPSLKVFDIQHALTRCRNDVEKAIDELLNSAFLQEESGAEASFVPKGIDGFVQYNPQQRKRKGKARKPRLDLLDKNYDSESAPPVLSPSPGPVENKWTTSKRDIDFIVSTTGLDAKRVTSVYHKSSGSVKNTIMAIADADIAKSKLTIEDEDPIIQLNISELAVDFPTILPQHLRGIVRITHPSTASAHELAKAFVRKPHVASSTVPSALIPQYARPVLDAAELDGEAGIFVASAKTVKQPTAIDRNDAISRAAALKEARFAAIAKANAAYRKSRSQPLMGGVASYYAERGQEARAANEELNQAVADNIVSQQSSRSQIDLHGIDVKNAVRISQQRVSSWWAGGQAEWAREGKVMGSGGFRIVTGVGKHSQGGKGKIGPAVKKALVQDCWRVEEEPGVLTVTGRARK